MDNAQPHVSVERGEGLVARFGDAIVLVTEDAAHEKGTGEVLQAVESAASGGESAAGVLAARLGTLVAGSEPGMVPPFGVVASLGDTYVVLLHGAVWAEVTGPDGSQRISGEQAVTWVDHIVDVAVLQLSVGSGAQEMEVDPRSDLRAGLVPGSGFVLTPSGSSTGSPAVVVDEPKEEPKEGAKVAGTAGVRATQGPSAPLEEIAPAPAPVTPIAAPAPSRPTTDLAPVTAPTVDAAPMESKPEPPRPDPPRPDPLKADLPRPDPPRPDPPRPDPPKADLPRPDPPKGSTLDMPAVGESVRPEREPAGATQMVVRPVGFLVATDGMRIPLDRAYVLGRAPEDDPGVTSGVATPIKLDDSDNLISRVHGVVSVKDGQVSVRDSSSANGTYIAKPGDAEWTRVGPDPVVLPPTWSLRVGKQVFTHMSVDSLSAST
ncbi:MAG TPA: FHA domain-containing protein [Acidimicrobiales bacterium]|nr:FHA domain-containing protein [Acidimicrobiales bacterium]